MDKYLNIVSFNIPYPANYGGVIDVYYKLEALRACGVKLILHCFEYERPHAPELESICDKVFYYKRRTGVIANLTNSTVRKSDNRRIHDRRRLFTKTISQSKDRVRSLFPRE